MNDDGDRQPQSRDVPVKKAYKKPALTEYGPVAKLTQSGGSTINEPAPMMRSGK